MIGVARDLWTGEAVDAPQVVGLEELRATLEADRTVRKVEASRCNPELAKLSGLRPRGELGKAILRLLPDEVAGATLLNRLLDDMATASFVSVHGWSAWIPDWVEQYTAAGLSARIDRDVTGVCVGFRRGSTALLPNGRSNIGLLSHGLAASPLRPDDPHAWHSFEPIEGPNQRRTRRLDLWLEDDVLHVDATFQDSAALPVDRERRLVFHEYNLTATIRPSDLTLKTATVTPAVLPFETCLAGLASPQRMIGLPVTSFDRKVPSILAGELGCTHLNDVLRALQDVGPLSQSLQQKIPDVGDGSALA